MVITIYFRKFSDTAFYKAASTKEVINGKLTEVIFSTDENGSTAVELYRGENYIVGSKDRSWSRCYRDSYKRDKISTMPKAYKRVVDELKAVHASVDDWNENWEKQFLIEL